MVRHDKLSAVLAISLVAFVPVAIAESGSGFTLELDPLVLEGRYLDVDTDSSKVEEYRDLSDGFRVPTLHLEGRSDDLRRELKLEIVNGGKRDAFYGFTYDVAGSWRLEAAYDSIPHNFGNSGRSLWTATAPGVYELQDPVQSALQGAVEKQFAANKAGVTFAFLDSLIQPYLAVSNEIDLGLVRRRSRAKLELGRAGAASWRIEYAHESRDGTRPFGASFGFNNATELPEPIHYDTTDAGLTGDWRWDKGVLALGYKYSTFENDVSTMFFDNPWRATDSSDPSAYSSPGSGSIGGSSRGFVDLAPDNQAGSFFLHGRFDITERSWLQTAVNWTKFEQDDPLLAFTLNTAINPTTGAPFVAADRANQPFSSANRKAESMRIALDYGARFGEGWQVGVRFNSQKYDDDSPRYEIPGYVRFHAVWEAIPRITVPFGYTRETLSGSLDKDFDRYGTLSFEAKRDATDREFRETETTVENTFGLAWNGRLGKALLRARIETGDREFDGHYDTEAAEASFADPEGSSNLPGLRKFDQANRKTDRFSVSADLPFAEVWTVALRASGTKFDYDESEFGLTGDETMRFGFDLARDIGDGGSLYLFGERSDRDVSQASRQSGATPSINPLDSWFVDFAEINDTWGAGWTTEGEVWQARVSGEWVRSDGKADISSPPGGAPNLGVGFDNYEDYERFGFAGTFDYDLTSHLAIGVNLLYEDYTIDSFIRQDLRNYLPGALLLVGDDGDYTAWAAGLRLKVRL